MTYPQTAIHPDETPDDQLRLMAEMRAEKAREARLRQLARRYGLELHKSRTRDPHGLDYGMYWLVDPSIPNVVIGRIPGDLITDCADLDDIEANLTAE